MKRFTQTLAAAAALSLSVVAADAATLTITNISGAWTGWKDGGRVNTATSGKTAQIRWGTTSGRQSGYDFTPVTTPVTEPSDTPFTLGNFTHRNFPIPTSSAITQATLKVAFDFYLGTDSSTIYKRSSTFVFDHLETLNASNPCANGQPNRSGVNINGCADRVVASTNPSSTETIEVVENGVVSKYVFAVDGFDIGDAFWTIENQTNTAGLKARFTNETFIQPAPVPLPAAAWMLIAGLGGIGVVGRRRRRAA